MTSTLTSVQIYFALAIGIAAIFDDLRRRQISNWISLSALISGLGWQVWAYGLAGAGAAFQGVAVGFVVFLLFYVLGGMGGGDVKLMAGFGALLGPGRCLEAALYTAVAGAILALLVLGGHAVMRFARTRSKPGVAAGVAAAAPRSIPYAPAIAAGVWLALVPH